MARQNLKQITHFKMSDMVRRILLSTICFMIFQNGGAQIHSRLFTSVNRSQLHPMPEYFDRYINLVDDISLQKAFNKSFDQLEGLDLKKLEAVGDKVYQPGKWTVKDILQHVIDAERILNYRVLRFARNDTTAAPDFDQDEVARSAKTSTRSFTEMISELKSVRQATVLLFQSFDDEALQRQGINWKYKVSVLAMGFMIAGHQKHHLKVIEEKYFPLLK